MNINCKNCNNDVENYLSLLPSKWRKKIAEIVCKYIICTKQSINCEDFKGCETITSISEFSQNGTELCISYTDEQGVTVERCYDFSSTINYTIDDVDQGCLATDEEWANMSYVERMQLIVDRACQDCTTTTTEEVTTTTTSATTTTTTSATTTTTTEATTTTTIGTTTTTTVETTTTTTGTTTTTTAAPIFGLYNMSTDATFEDVTPVNYSGITYPVNPAYNSVGTHTGFSGNITVDVTTTLGSYEIVLVVNLVVRDIITATLSGSYILSAGTINPGDNVAITISNI